MNIFFRADGNSEIGLGHLTRSLALMSMIKKYFNNVFVIKEKTLPFFKSITAGDKISFITIPETIDTENEPEFLKEHIYPGDILILDGYHFTAAYQAKIYRESIKLGCIDDLHDIVFSADFIINHSIGVDQSKYNAKYYTRFLLGGHYALLRTPFLEKKIIERNYRKKVAVIICFGGADPLDYTASTLLKIVKNQHIEKLNIIVGSAYKNIDLLKETVQVLDDSRIQLFVNIGAEEMRSIMEQSEIAVCSASSVAIEYMSVSGGLFIIKSAANQKEIFENAIKLNAAFDFNEFDLEKDFQKIINVQNSIFDGNINERYLKVFNSLALESSLVCRKALSDDMKQYYVWANDEVTRSNSYNASFINLINHEVWFNNKIKDENSLLYIFFSNTIPVGQVRFEINLDSTAMIGFSIDKNFRGKGIGRMILKTGIEKLHREENILRFEGYVKFENLQSSAIFESLGFEKKGTEKFPHSWVYTLNIEEDASI